MTAAAALGVGLHPGVPFAEYLNWPLPSQSTLKEGRASMAHVKAAMDRERVKVPTDAMNLGSALHVCFLEPERMPERVVLWEGARRAGNEWKAFRDEHAGKIILTNGFYERMLGMVKSLRRHPVVRQWVGKIEDTEVAAVGEVNGVMMKGRCDALTAEPLVDLKMTRSADAATFTRTVLAFGYHMQGYIYRRLFDRERWLLLAVEDQPPFDVVPYELTPSFLRHGAEECNALLERYKRCSESGLWPGRSDGVVELEVPEWCGVNADEITFGGARVFEDGGEE